MILHHGASHHAAAHPSYITPTPELAGSHSAIASPLSSAVECHGCYRIIGPATIMKPREGAPLEAFLGAGAILELFHPDGDILVTHNVSCRVP
jgi:hypothetical protein